MKTDFLLEHTLDIVRQRRLVPLYSAILLLLLFCIGLVLSEIFAAGPTRPGNHPHNFVVKTGYSVREVGAKLEQSGVIRSAGSFRLLARILDLDTRLQAGEYHINSGISLLAVLNTLIEGEVILRPITFPEGWTSASMAHHLAQSDLLEGPLPDSLPEGIYLPDTYFVARGDSRSALLQRMHTAHKEALQDLWDNRQPDLPLQNMEQARILASIVEKETRKPEELRRVAAVFINRLRKNMRLESDPTVIYGITGGLPLRRGLRQSELKNHTPYNTYRIDGIPPTPICNPGLKALAATLNPAATKDLFFVADGKGGHRFATDYAQHQHNVKKWRMPKAAPSLKSATSKGL